MVIRRNDGNAYFHMAVFIPPLNSVITPQYGHSFVSGNGGNNSLLFTRTDFARGTSTEESAYRALTAVCRAVVAYVTGAGGIAVLFGILALSLGCGEMPEANRTLGAFSVIFGSGKPLV